MKKFNFESFNPAGGSGATVFDTDFLDERLELIGHIVLEGDTTSWASVIPFVKNRVSLNEITNVADVQDASCGWEMGEKSANFVQRELIVAAKEIKDEICPKNLEKTYMGMYMRTNKEVPFERVIIDQYIKRANEYAEKFVWQGDGVVNGLYQIAEAEAGVDVSIAVDGAGNMIDKVNIMVAAAPATVLEREDGVLCMGYSDFMTLVQELNYAANYHIEFNEGAPMEFYFPGTRIMVKAVAGMNGIATPTKGTPMILTYKENIVVGVDMTDDGDEKVDMWYSRDADTVRVNVQFKIGSQFYFPDLVVKGYTI